MHQSLLKKVVLTVQVLRGACRQKVLHRVLALVEAECNSGKRNNISGTEHSPHPAALRPSRVPMMRGAEPAPRRGAARAGYSSPTCSAARTVSRCRRSASRMSAAICGDTAVRRGQRRPGPVRGGDRGYLEDALLLPPLVFGQRLLQSLREALVLLGRHQAPLPQRRLRPVLPPEPRRLPAVLGPAGHRDTVSTARTGHAPQEPGVRQHRPAPFLPTHPARCCSSPACSSASPPLRPCRRTPRPQHGHHTRPSCSAGS